MKSFTILAPFAALLATPVLSQWLPSCSFNDCMASWDSSTCDQSSGWSCLCSNATAISELNTCVATSCTNTTDQEAVYGAIAQICANQNETVTNSQQATFSATYGGSAWPTITGTGGFGPGGRWGNGDWSSWVSACSGALGAAPTGWGGRGPWGNSGGWHGGASSGAFGPWGTKASGVDCSAWTTWTAGWGTHSQWTGTWSGCSTTTAAPVPATVTTTITSNGQVTVVTGTTFGIQAQAVATTGSSSDNGGSDIRATGIAGAAAAGVFAVMLAL